MKLGKNQLQRLMSLGSPTFLLIVGGDKVSRSLQARGLLVNHFPDNPDAWIRITPAGLRALADAHEAGLLNQFMTKFPPRASSNEG